MADEATLAKTNAPETAKAEMTRGGACYRPNVDILELTDELIVQADLPGARPDTIDIDFKEGVLTIHAKVAPREKGRTEYLLREYGVGDFWRTFQVSEAIDASKITAQFADGVLALHLPKAEAAKPRKITVSTSA